MRFGHNRDHENLPQENLAVVCDRADGIMLPFCCLLPDSVPDVVTLEATARVLRALGLEDSEFVLDRASTATAAATATCGTCFSGGTISPSAHYSPVGSHASRFGALRLLKACG